MKTRALMGLFIVTALSVLLSPEAGAYQGVTPPQSYYSKDEATGNDYVLAFCISGYAQWSIEGSTSQIQRVIDYAIGHGGITVQRAIYGPQVIRFSTCARARWYNGYFGSLNHYAGNVKLRYWW